MAEFNVIKESEAPQPAAGSRLNARMAEYEGYVSAVKRGQVGRLVPGPAESARGVALRAARAGRRLDKDVKTWVVDGIVYFSVT